MLILRKFLDHRCIHQIIFCLPMHQDQQTEHYYAQLLHFDKCNIYLLLFLWKPISTNQKKLSAGSSKNCPHLFSVFEQSVPHHFSSQNSVHRVVELNLGWLRSSFRREQTIIGFKAVVEGFVEGVTIGCFLVLTQFLQGKRVLFTEGR